VKLGWILKRWWSSEWGKVGEKVWARSVGATWVGGSCIDAVVPAFYSYELWEIACTPKSLSYLVPTIKANRVLVIWLEYPNSNEVPKSKRNLNQNPIARVHESATTLADSPCMGINTLEAPRLPAAHHPSTESDTAAFCPPRMGRKIYPSCNALPASYFPKRPTWSVKWPPSYGQWNFLFIK